MGVCTYTRIHPVLHLYVALDTPIRTAYKNRFFYLHSICLALKMQIGRNRRLMCHGVT